MNGSNKKRFGKRLLYTLAGVFSIVLILLLRPVTHLLFADSHESELPPVPSGYADDVSRLNATRIDSTVKVADTDSAAIQQVRELLLYAKAHHLAVSISGSKHSMGGHTIAPDGIRIDMLPFKQMSLDTVTGILSVGAGATWASVIPYLNRYRRAVAVMQSDNAFSVGGSISVNCHGWQHNTSPIASTVLSFRIIKADGTLLTCSRDENKELFSLALGGYGLFGLILDVKLRTVPNEMYTYHRVKMTSDKYPEYYARYIDSNPQVRMVYGRLNVDREHFLEEAMLNYFSYECPAGADCDISNESYNSLKTSVFEGTKRDEYGKKLRWDTEQLFSKTMIGKQYARNQVMNENPSYYLNRDSTRTDILHEYFIPRKNFGLFIAQLQKIVPQHRQDLLNVTIRNVYRDEDTFLRYASEEMFAFVLFFNQEKSKEAEEDMQGLTRELIDAASRLKGTYYLPYRLHATPQQFNACYSMAGEFFQKKREYDPQEIFQNKFYLQYGKIPAK